LKASGFELNYDRTEHIVSSNQYKNSVTVWIELEFVKPVKTNEECADSITRIQEMLHTKVNWDEFDKKGNVVYRVGPVKYPPKEFIG